MKSALLLALLVGAFLLAAVPRDGGELPWTVRDDTWRTDPVWYDGLAEVCTYEATRSIYGLERHYVARAYTNKQMMDSVTFVKAADATDASNVEVFKHHWSELIPTENYDYDFSTAAFLTAAALAPFRLTIGTQEDCGASFKQVQWDGSDITWVAFVYHPDEGLSQGRVEGAPAWYDALTLCLRDYPFLESERALKSGPGITLELTLLPSQKTPRAASFEPLPHRVNFIGREAIQVPAGDVDSFHLRVEPVTGDAYPTDLWFAADAGAPWLHALVQLEGPGGVSYRLQSIERAAYWERSAR